MLHMLLLLPPQTDKAISMLIELLVGFVSSGMLSSTEVVGGLQPSTSTLGDLA
jgi:hypothetical protein